MKLLAVVAAGILAASALTPVTSASAAPAPDRWSHGHHGWKWKRVCTVRWHHGHKVRTCRKVRVRW